MTSGGHLTGARVRRADVPHGDLVALSLAHPDGRKDVLILSVAEGAMGLGLVDDRPRGAPAEGFARVLRRTVGNAVVESVTETDDGAARVELRRGEARWALLLDPDAADVVLLDGEGRLAGSLGSGTRSVHGIARGQLHPSASATGHALDPGTLRRRGPELMGGRAASHHAWRWRRLEQALTRQRKKLRRRERAVEGDLGRMEQVPALRRDASLLLSNLHALEPKARQATVTDWEADPPCERTLAIDPRLGPKGQADAWFQRARRLERGRTIASDRLARTRKELAAVEGLLSEVTSAARGEDPDPLERRARDLGVVVSDAAGAGGPSGRRAASTKADARMPFHRFVTHGGRPILVGRGAADNDALTLHHTRPHDLWLHVRGRTGAHVVVPLDRGEACPPDVLADAAMLAAHYSDARGEPVVEVQYTPRRFVRKPRGSAPGSVTIEREKVIAVRIEPDRLAALLGRPD